MQLHTHVCVSVHTGMRTSLCLSLCVHASACSTSLGSYSAYSLRCWRALLHHAARPFAFDMRGRIQRSDAASCAPLALLAFFALAPDAAMLAHAGAAALAAVAPLAVMVADAGAAAVLADAPDAVMLADARAPAVLAVAPADVMLADARAPAVLALDQCFPASIKREKGGGRRGDTVCGSNYRIFIPIRKHSILS